jgi:transcriptional regulator with XRE-family HTH domain
MADHLLQQSANKANAFHESFGISQKRMAQALSIDSTAYCRFLKGERGLSLDRVARLLELMKDPRKLLTFSTNRIEHEQHFTL